MVMIASTMNSHLYVRSALLILSSSSNLELTSNLRGHASCADWCTQPLACYHVSMYFYDTNVPGQLTYRYPANIVPSGLAMKNSDTRLPISFGLYHEPMT